jgi:hypothetical protein
VYVVVWSLSYDESARLIEQPQSSLMQAHPRIAGLIRYCSDHLHFNTVKCWLGCLGAASPKPIMIFGSACGGLAPLWRVCHPHVLLVGLVSKQLAVVCVFSGCV